MADRLKELRDAAMAGKNIADYDHAALARYVTALNPKTVLELLDLAEAVRAMDTVCGYACGNPHKCGNCRAVLVALDALDKSA